MAETKTVYQYGAADGIKMGCLLSVVFVLQSLGLGNIKLMLAGDLLMLFVPVYAFVLMRRLYKATPVLRTFSGVWMHGIVTFIGGSLIMALVAYIYLRFVDPGFMSRQIEVVAGMYRELGTAQSIRFARALDDMIKQHAVPSPIQMAFSMMWLVSFAGAMLSLVISVIFKIFPPVRTAPLK